VKKGEKLVVHISLGPWSRMHGVLPPFPLHAFMARRLSGGNNNFAMAASTKG